MTAVPSGRVRRQILAIPRARGLATPARARFVERSGEAGGHAGGPGFRRPVDRLLDPVRAALGGG